MGRPTAPPAADAARRAAPLFTPGTDRCRPAVKPAVKPAVASDVQPAERGNADSATVRSGESRWTNGYRHRGVRSGRCALNVRLATDTF